MQVRGAPPENLSLIQMAAENRSSLRTRRTLVICSLTAAVAVVAALTVLAVSWAPLRSQILLSVTKRPAPYTELYFTDFAALPRLVYPGHTYQVPYTVVGHDERAKTVTATGTVQAGSRHLSLGRQTLRFGPGGRVAGSFDFSPPVRYAVYYVEVTLSGGPHIQWRVVAP